MFYIDVTIAKHYTVLMSSAGQRTVVISISAWIGILLTRHSHYCNSSLLCTAPYFVRAAWAGLVLMMMVRVVDTNYDEM